jgi:Right handed beta helix region
VKNLIVKQTIIILGLLTITVLPALANPNITNAPWGVDAAAFKNLSTALTASATVGKTVVVSTPMILNNMTTDRSIVVMDGGRINVASGKTLIFTSGSTFSAGSHQVFTGSGLVKGLKSAHPEWFENNSIPGTTDMTKAFTMAINAASEVTGMQGAVYRISSVPLVSNRRLVGNGAVITSMAAGNGQLTGSSLNNVAIEGWEFRGVPGTNYNPVIFLTSSNNIFIKDNWFDGVGFGVNITNSSRITATGNQGVQIGISPRPVGAGTGYGTAYTTYGGFLFFSQSTDIVVSNNQMHNTTPASGYGADSAGGAGGITCSICDRVTINGNIIRNAPGQCIAVVGSYQATDVPTKIISGKLDKSLRGQRIAISGNIVEGCNQEGITAFGVGNISITGNSSNTNRFTSIEVWDSWDATVTGNNVYEPSSADMAIFGMRGGIGGKGAIDVIRSYGAIVANNIIQGARTNGISMEGSYNFNVNNNIIREFGLNDSLNGYEASGVEIAGIQSLNPGNGIVSGNTFFRTPNVNNSGKILYQDNVFPVRSIREWGNFSLNGALTYYPNETLWSGIGSAFGN